MKISFVNKCEKFLSLTRFINSTMAFIGVILGAFIANIPLNHYHHILLAALSAALISAFGNVDNDIIDIDIDRDEGKQRALVTNEVSLFEAKIFRALLLIIGNTIVIHLPILFAVSITVSVLLFIYNRVLKRKALIGNIVVAFMVGLTFLYGNLLSIYFSENFNYDLIPFLLAFFINMSRELTKDCEDIDGDSANNLTTFPIVFGLKKSQFLIFSFNIILLLIIIYPSLFLSYGYIFYIINIFTTIPIILWALKILTSKMTKASYGKLSKMYKIAMLTGVLSLFADNISL